MPDSLAAVVLAAGAGTRLRPLTAVRPKACCPVGDRPLLAWALDRVAAAVGEGPAATAVNAHHLADQVEAAVGDRATLSVEQPLALGTGGALTRLRPWLAGRPALVVNADTWSTVDLAALAAQWDGRQVRLVVSGPMPGATVVAAFHPPDAVAELPDGPSALDRECWAPRARAGRLEVVALGAEAGVAIACDRPREYLAANLAVSGGASVVGAGASVACPLERTVVWPGVAVGGREVLVDAVCYAERRTVYVR